MGRAATSGIGAGGIDGGVAFLDIDYLPLLIHHKRGAICDPGLGYENAVRGDNFAVQEIAQQGERCVELGGKFFLGGSVIGTDAKNFGVVAFKFRNTSLVCRDFAGSTTGKGGGEKRQHNGVFPAEAGKSDLSALGRSQSEVRRHVAFLQRGVRRLDVLGEETRREQPGRERKRFSHGSHRTAAASLTAGPGTRQCPGNPGPKFEYWYMQGDIWNALYVCRSDDDGSGADSRAGVCSGRPCAREPIQADSESDESR